MHLSETSRRLLDVSRETLFLGIITASGEILLRPASASECAGHAEWRKRVPSLEAVGGFSVVARAGRVSEIYRASILNPSAQDGLLGLDAVEELKRVLPVAEDLLVYGH